LHGGPRLHEIRANPDLHSTTLLKILSLLRILIRAGVS
jgi:hypothetical protein